jgi:hypothetical protein
MKKSLNDVLFFDLLVYGVCIIKVENDKIERINPLALYKEKMDGKSNMTNLDVLM